MKKTTFDKFRRLVYEKSGILLNEGKESLVASRIGKRMRMLGIDNHDKYLKYVTEDKDGTELVLFLDVISTNVTHFFRESRHFDFFGQEIKKLCNAGQSKIRIWCAASSSGEEPYSIAMTFLENANNFYGDVKILATDISTRILKQAKAGEYVESKINKVPSVLLSRYFDKNSNSQDVKYKAKPSITNMITFARLNLSQTPYPMQGPFDFIFCRNVMIYFDNIVRSKLLKEAYRLLKPGGFLIVGHAESLTGMLSNLKTVEPSIYIKQ